jgi:glycosyltransferase family protein
MKKFLLFFWNRFYFFKKFLSEKFHLIIDAFYAKKFKAPQVMSAGETVNYIIKNKCSAVRFGDGEIKLISGKALDFQKPLPKIREKLSESLSSHNPEVLVCIPDIFSEKSLAQYTDEAAAHWKKHLSYFRKNWCGLIDGNCVYGNAFISRPYNNYRDKSGCKDYFKAVKMMWDGIDIVVAEGEKSRLGMGNDLFDNARSVQRILCPVTECFDKYDDIVREIEKFSKDKLILLALGPTASVMPQELSKKGYRAVDIGNIDTEYEWFLSGADKKIPIKNKLVYEAGGDNMIGEATDEKYLSQIVAKIE